MLSLWQDKQKKIYSANTQLAIKYMKAIKFTRFITFNDVTVNRLLTIVNVQIYNYIVRYYNAKIKLLL